MLSDTVSPISLCHLQPTITSSIYLIGTFHVSSHKKAGAFKWAVANIGFERYEMVCLHRTNYSANYTLGKLILEAKDFITFISTNIVLWYKLPGSLDTVTFYFHIPNRFIICSGKKTFFLNCSFNFLNIRWMLSTSRDIWEGKKYMCFLSLASNLHHWCRIS